MAAKMGIFGRGDAGNGAQKAPHIGAAKFVKPASNDNAYGRWMYQRGYEIENCTTDEQAAGWMDAEAES